MIHVTLEESSMFFLFFSRRPLLRKKLNREVSIGAPLPAIVTQAKAVILLIDDQDISTIQY